MTATAHEPVLIVGAGAIGLSAAYLLSREGVPVTVLEAAAAPGGVMRTFEAAPGVRLECFYHHLFTHDAELRWLLGELDLADALTFLPASMGLFRDRVLHPFNGPRDVLRLRALSLPARLRFALSSALLAYGPGYAAAEDTPALAWFRRVAGAEATAAIWEPMLAIKFDRAAQTLPLSWMAGRLRQRVRSRTAGGERLGYLRGSLQTLAAALVAAIEQGGGAVHCESAVDGLVLADGKVVGVRSGERVWRGARVLCTVPAPVLAPWLREADLCAARTCEALRYFETVCTVLSLNRSAIPVYWLNVADPGFHFGGVIEQTRLIPPEQYGGAHLVYLSRYVLPGDPLTDMTDEAVVAEEVEQLGRITGAPLAEAVQRHWVFRERHAAPVTPLGFSRQVPPYDLGVEGLYAASMCHVYPDERSVNNAIRVAVELVRAARLPCPAVPEGISLAGRWGEDPAGQECPAYGARGIAGSS